MIHHGDLFDVLPTLDAESIDACVTDPPYGLEFMGKEWDAPWKHTFTEAGSRPGVMLPVSSTRNPVCLTCRKHQRGSKSCQCESPDFDETPQSNNALFQAWTERWAREVFRVLKPGAHVLVCGAPRSFHRMSCGLEDAGFQMRDCLSWLYGQGFPKSLNLGDGHGTALKPGWEPIVLARKPTKGTVKANVERFGTGTLEIDACRLSVLDGEIITAGHADSIRNGTYHEHEGWDRPWKQDGERYAEKRDAAIERANMLGRWPANVLMDEEAAAMLDEQSGVLSSHDTTGIWSGSSKQKRQGNAYGVFTTITKDEAKLGRADRGGASRFYYVAKPSREERNYGCGSNGHPTVKPIELMRWLVRLVTPPNGTVLDPFCGSGTTGMACRYELRQFIGIEREAEYVAVAELRIAACVPLFSDEASAQ